MAIQKAINANPYRKQNCGTVFGAGNIGTGGPITKSLNVVDSVPTNTLYGSQVPDSTAVKAISAGKFGNFVNGNYIVRGLSGTIAGQTSTLLRSGTSEFGQKRYPKAKTSDRRYHITSWSYTTGAATKGGNAGDSFSFGADHAFSGTNAIPGEFTYMLTGLTATNADYLPRYI